MKTLILTAFILYSISQCIAQKDITTAADGSSIVNIYQGLPINNITTAFRTILKRLDDMQVSDSELFLTDPEDSINNN